MVNQKEKESPIKSNFSTLSNKAQKTLKFSLAPCVTTRASAKTTCGFTLKAFTSMAHSHISAIIALQVFSPCRNFMST